MLANRFRDFMRNSGDTDAPTTRLAPGLDPLGIAIFAIYLVTGRRLSCVAYECLRHGRGGFRHFPWQRLSFPNPTELAKPRGQLIRHCPDFFDRINCHFQMTRPLSVCTV